jgi:hypothetical protein
MSKITGRMDLEMRGISMSELNYNRSGFYTGIESEDELQATADEVREFKEQYDVMTREEKARLPNWLLEYFQQI